MPYMECLLSNDAVHSRHSSRKCFKAWDHKLIHVHSTCRLFVNAPILVSAEGGDLAFRMSARNLPPVQACVDDYCRLYKL